MGPSAHVLSVELLKRLHSALARFRVDAQTALGAGAMELHRVQDTLEDRLKYWQHQIHKRQEESAQGRAALSFARAVHEGQSIGCVEQELALHRAKERLHEAEAKVALVRRWQRELPEFMKEFEGPARSLSGFVETDLRLALVQLDNKIASLEAYLALASPREDKPAPMPPPDKASPPAQESS